MTADATDKPITWREFKNLTMQDVKEGDLVLFDPVFGVAHVTKIEDYDDAVGSSGRDATHQQLSGQHLGPVRRLTLEYRSLAFPHLASDLEHFERDRFVSGSIIRGKYEPVLIVHVVHPRNPHPGSLPADPSPGGKGT
jgi:hypothetical protein